MRGFKFWFVVILAVSLQGCQGYEEFFLEVGFIRFKTDNTFHIGVNNVAIAQCQQLGGLRPALGQYPVVAQCNLTLPASQDASSATENPYFSWQVPIRFSGDFTLDPTAPILLQVPADSSQFSASYSGGINGDAVITDHGDCVLAGPNRPICAESGFKLLSLEMDNNSINQLAMSGVVTASFQLQFTLASDQDTYFRALYSVKVSQNGQDYFIPILNNVNHMADAPRIDLSPSVPSITQPQLPFDDSAEFVNVADNGSFSVPAGISGSWYDPDFDGEGWNLQLLGGGLALAYWFSYDGNGNQAWFYGLGRVSGNTITFNALRQPMGGRFGSGFDPAQVSQPLWGTMALVFDDCNSGYMAYSGKTGFDTGEMNIQRITGLQNIPCGTAKAPRPVRAKAVSSQMSGPWYDPSHDGEGWLLEILDDSTAVAYWFTYDASGNQAWFVGVGSINGDSIQFDEVLRPVGGRFGMNSYNPSQINRKTAGSMQFTFTSCSTGSMSYDLSTAGFGSGSLSLQKIVNIEGDGCSMQ